MKVETLRQIFLDSVSKYADLACFSLYEYPDEALTYREFGERVEQVSEMLREAGLGSGDHVALLSTNMPNWPVCYFAAVTCGMVIVPILPDFSGPELDRIIKHSDCKGLFVSDKLYSKISKPVIDRLNVVIRTKNLGIIAQGTCAAGTCTEPDPDDVAAIIYTSGTTSKPKGVMLTHHNLVRQLEMEFELFPIKTDDVFLSILPLAHTYECSVGMMLPFMSGASVVYLDRAPTASTLVPAMGKVRPTIMLSVPLIIEKLYRSQIAARFKNNKWLKRLYSYDWFRKLVHRFAGGRIKNLFGGRIRFFGIGGARLDSDTERFLSEAGFPYAIGYGLTETAPLIAGAVPGKVPFRSTGPILKGIRARLENINPETGEGELVVLSPSAMKGYYKNPEATREVFTKDGWLRTKDLVRFDEEGNLYIKGRVGSMIVSPSGENIYPEEIESVLNSHSLVADSIVREEQGKLVALVQFNREELEDKYEQFKHEVSTSLEDAKEDLMRYVNSQVSKFSHISKVEEQPEGFEKTPTLKIKRFLYSKDEKEKKGGKRPAASKKPDAKHSGKKTKPAGKKKSNQPRSGKPSGS